MGLFGFGKKKPEPQKAPLSESEKLDELYRQIGKQSSLQGREALEQELYTRAKDYLLKAPTQEAFNHAFGLIEKLASYGYCPAILYMGDFEEKVRHNYQQACLWYQSAADRGNGEGARCYADMLMIGKGTVQDPMEARIYYKLAMDKGIPEAAFVMGEFYRNEGNRLAVLIAYQKALDGGYEPARTRIEQLENG